jgi:uncharacterized protein
VTKLVLDTNIVLDWLVFADPSMNSLAEAVRLEQIALHTYAPALDELQRVLSYAALKLDKHRQATLFNHYRALTRQFALPAGFGPHNLMLPTGFPQCKDSDDQHFLAMALHTQADALVSRDKAVLTLRKRAIKFGLAIVDVQQMITILSPLSRSL